MRGHEQREDVGRGRVGAWGEVVEYGRLSPSFAFPLRSFPITFLYTFAEEAAAEGQHPFAEGAAAIQ